MEIPDESVSGEVSYNGPWLENHGIRDWLNDYGSFYFDVESKYGPAFELIEGDFVPNIIFDFDNGYTVAMINLCCGWEEASRFAQQMDAAEACITSISIGDRVSAVDGVVYLSEFSIDGKLFNNEGRVHVLDFESQSNSSGSPATSLLVDQAARNASISLLKRSQGMDSHKFNADDYIDFVGGLISNSKTTASTSPTPYLLKAPVVENPPIADSLVELERV